ncbi:hypothetical protein PTKIN_Ptkin04bG0056700 [Pterospermum kingtungense]
MEVISFPNSSLLNVKGSSSSEKKKRKKKRRKNQAIEFGNAESKETENCLGKESKLDFEANVENSLTKDADLVVEPKVNDSLESNSLMKGTISGGDLNVETVENNIGLESGLKGSGLNEQQEHSDRKGKRKRKRKKEQKEGPESVVELIGVKGNSLIDDKQRGSNLESGLEGVQLKEQPDDSERKRESMKERKEGVESVAELRDVKGNSLIDENQTGSNLKSGLEGVQLKEQPADYKGKRKGWRKRKMAKAGQFEKMDEKSVVEMSDGKEKSVTDEKQSDFHLESKVNVSLQSGLKEGENSLVKDAPLERDSHIEVLEKISSESGFKGSQLNEQPVGSKRKRKKKRNHKLAIDEQCRKLDAESVLELGDSKENSLIDEKQRDCHVEPKLSVSLESGLKEGANSDLGTLNNISLESGLKGTQLNEQTVQLLSKRQRKRKKQKMKRLRGDKYISSKRNDRDSSEAENKNMCPEPQRDPPQSASTDMVETQNLHVDRDLVSPEMEAIPSLSHGNGSYPFSVKENSLIDEKQRDCHTESKVSVSLESGLKEGANSDLGTLNNISLESGLKEGANSDLGTQLNEQMVELLSKRQRKRKKQKMKRLREDKYISSKRNDRDSSEAENKNMCPEPQRDPPQSASTDMVETQNLHVDRDLVLPELEAIPSLSHGNGSYPFSVKENSLIDERQRDCHTESKVSVSLESGLKEGANSDLGTLNNISLESELKGTQLNSKRNDRDISEAENKNICPEPQRDPPQSASTDMVETQNLHVDRDLVLPEMEVIPSLSNLAGVKDDIALKATAEQNSLSQTLYSSLGRIGFSGPKKKLLVLDLNGILVDVVQKPDGLRPNFRVSKKAVFKRPFCGDFLNFCFSTFNVAIWSSRTYKNVKKLVHRLMPKRKCNLLFCWHRRQCTVTRFKTIEDKKKPIVLKELRKVWEKHEGNLTWGKGEYDESNTLLLDDSPYKALRNPVNTAVFPYPFQYKDAGDSSLGPDGDIRKYLEGLAAAENVQKYVEQNPFGQPAITESNPHWDFYSQIIDYKK